jgi:hypothetical protein
MEMQTKICKGPLCEGKEHPITNFSSKGSQCKKCNCHKIKEYYKINNRSYRKAKNIIKEKSSCVVCGCNDIRLLEFDHLGEKNIMIGKSFSSEKIKEEVKLTQILCVWCHRLKSREQMDKLKDKLTLKFNIDKRPINNEEGRSCIGPICKGELQYFENFNNSRKRKISYCKICLAYNARIKREHNFNFNNNLKLSKKECEICKIQVTEENVCCFDFDHLHDKSVNISFLTRINKDTTQQMLEESKKCRLLCCKCHRIHTAEQLNYNYSVN